MTITTENVIEITSNALEQITALRDQEAIPDLYLGLRIAGVGANGFQYETAFVRGEDIPEVDHRETHGTLAVAIPPGSVENLRGSVLDMSDDPAAPGLVLRNPNPATPAGVPDLGDIELEGTVEERITQLLEQQINPAIASHGGWVRLVALDGAAAHLEMGGGCQGCGLAAMTLRDGIEAAIKQHIPEIEEIVDSTNHEAGMNPFYQ
jgi:Fe/S biogenesis protein NfuA